MRCSQTPPPLLLLQTKTQHVQVMSLDNWTMRLLDSHNLPSLPGIGDGEACSDLPCLFWLVLACPDHLGVGWGSEGRLPSAGQFCLESLQVACYTTGQHFLEHEVSSGGLAPNVRQLASNHCRQQHCPCSLPSNDRHKNVTSTHRQSRSSFELYHGRWPQGHEMLFLLHSQGKTLWRH